MSSRLQCKIIPSFTSAASMILLSWNTWLKTIAQAWFYFYGAIKTSLLIHLITSKYSILVGGERQTLRVISYQKHHFPYNQTGSFCCHGDERLRFYSSDCLSSALCTQDWGLIWGYSCVLLRSNYHHQDGVVQFVRLLCLTWNCCCPSSSFPWRDNAAFIPPLRLLLFLWRESVRSLQSVLC